MTQDTSAVIKKAIARGIQERFFGYYSGSTPVFGDDEKYQVPLARLRFDTIVGEDEIDMDSGFLMMPQALPLPAPSPATAATGATGVAAGAPSGESTPTPGGPSVVPGASSSDGPPVQKSVEINFSADRNQLFTAWNAIANLADLAGKVNVTVRADSAEGFDRSKLQNGVWEPLRESDLID